MAARLRAARSSVRLQLVHLVDFCGIENKETKTIFKRRNKKDKKKETEKHEKKKYLLILVGPIQSERSKDIKMVRLLAFSAAFRPRLPDSVRHPAAGPAGCLGCLQAASLLGSSILLFVSWDRSRPNKNTVRTVLKGIDFIRKRMFLKEIGIGIDLDPPARWEIRSPASLTSPSTARAARTAARTSPSASARAKFVRCLRTSSAELPVSARELAGHVVFGMRDRNLEIGVLQSAARKRQTHALQSMTYACKGSCLLI